MSPATETGAGLRLVELLPLDPAPPLEAIAAALSRRLHVPCRVRLAAAITARSVDGRDQLDADDLLRQVEKLGPAPGVAVIGITARDVGTPIFLWVFGRARRGSRGAIVSTARLDPSFYGMPPDENRLVRRTVAEVLHEMGHLAGLDHCADPACLMHFATAVAEADLRGDRVCAGCAPHVPFLRAPLPG